MSRTAAAPVPASEALDRLAAPPPWLGAIPWVIPQLIINSAASLIP